MKIALLLFASLFAFFSAIAQTEKMDFKNLTTEMGLSHGDVTNIYQDHDGFLWFGTVNGLNKYNGIEFTVYTYNKNDTTSISNNYINSIYVDKQNNVWIGTAYGLCRYNRDRDNIERIPFIDNNNQLLQRSVTAICEDEYNQLWIGTNFGVYLFDAEKKQFIPYFFENNGREIVNCTGISFDKNGILWSSFSDLKAGGLLKYDPVNKLSTFYNNQHTLLKLKENFINCLYVDNKNNIWIGYFNEGIDVINEKAQIITNYQNDPENESSLNNNTIFSIVQNTDGKFLIGTGGGLDILDIKSNKFSHNIASESDRTLLSNTIQNIYKGFDGTIWIACWAGGVSIFDKRYDKFTHYQHEKENVNSLSGNSITCFAEDINKNIWIASDGDGINYFNPVDKKFINYQSNSKNSQTLTNNKVLALAIDTRGDLWAGMWDGGINLFKINKSKLILKKKYQYVEENNTASTSVFKLYVNKNGQLWAGNFRTGAYILDTNTYKFTPFPILDSTNEPLSFIILRDILWDYRNDIWFGTQGSGLIRYTSTTNNYEQFVQKEGDSTTLQSNSINVIFEDSKQRIWIGADYGGLNLFNRGTKKFTHFSTEQGLPSNTVVGILEDSKGSLWISTFNGISKVSIDSTNGTLKLSFRNYSIQDGLQGKVFNRWAYLKSSKGVMYFGGLNGFNVFNPDSIKDNSFIPPVHITDFLLFNKPVAIGANGSPLDKHISQTKKIILNYDQSVFTFRFVALNYIFSEENQYAYIMEGFEGNWNYVGNKREATYTNLDPGEYTFKVKASNNDDIWNEEGASIKIIILPPWWMTLWFRITAILIILSSFTGFYRMRVSALNKQKFQLEKLVVERTREIEEKNKMLYKKTTDLNESNVLLEERQQQVEEQTEELSISNEKLIMLNATKDKFFSIIAHDLKNPFAAILGFCEVLLARYDNYEDTKRKHLIGVINQSAQNLYKLLENLLQWARSQTGSINFEPEEFNLFEMVQNNKDLVNESLTEKNLSLVIDISPDQQIIADKNMINTVIRNLLTNSIKFSKEGEITIRAKDSEKSTHVSITDNGIGIQDDVKDIIFEIVKPKSTEGTRGESGTGLGLIICKEFIEKHKGSIGVESEFGKGSTFFFTIPKKNPE